MDGWDLTWVEHRSRNVACGQAGQGKPILMLDAWTTNLDEELDEPGRSAILRRVASSARLIRWDRSGMGLSDRCPPPASEAIEVWADEAIAVLDALEQDTTMILSSGWTVPIAIAIAARYPKRVTRLAIHAGAARIEASSDHPWGVAPEVLAAGKVQVLERWGSGIIPDVLGMEIDERRRTREGRIERNSVARGDLEPILTAYCEADVRHLLPAIEAPTLATYGDAPFQDWEGQASYLAQHIPNATVRRVENNRWDFAVANEETQESLLVALEFLLGTDMEIPSRQQLATVVFIDIVGSTGTASRLGDREWTDLLASFRTRIETITAFHHGSVVSSAGDGFFLLFHSASSAIACCIEMRSGATDFRLEVRSGVHSGECQIVGEDIQGMAINIAARIIGLAEPSEILISDITRMLASTPVQPQPHGTHTLRGVPGTWDLFAL